MLNKRYVVIASREQGQGVKSEGVRSESLELATRLQGIDGTELFVYRDNFIAYKVATLTGGRVQLGYIVVDNLAVDNLSAEDDLTLEDGSRLRLERQVERQPLTS